jgi:hypothetical protein
VTYLAIPEPAWTGLAGGDEQEAKWVADRDRKFALMMDSVERLMPISSQLADQGDLLHCTPAVLREIPQAADWYVCAAGYALNTLQYIREAPTNYGLNRRVRGVRDRIMKGGDVPDEQLAAFSNWVNAELSILYKGPRDLATVRAIAFGVLGARAVGQGQNIGGEDGVYLLRRLVADRAVVLGIPVHADTGDGFVHIDTDPTLIHRTRKLRLGTNILCDFSGGGRHADILVTDQRVVLALGEIKARKDVSNIWESWMPQIVDHMRTWAGDAPDAARLFFGTLITEEMLDGLTSGGVRRAGLKTLYENGLLSSAYNLSKIAAGDPASVREFEIFMRSLARRVR